MSLRDLFHKKKKNNEETRISRASEPGKIDASLLSSRQLIRMLYNEPAPRGKVFDGEAHVIENASKRYQELMEDPNNKDFITEFSSWYLKWSDGQYDPQKTPDKLVDIGYMLQTCDCGGVGGFEKCIDLFHSGAEFTPFQKIGIINQAVKLVVLSDLNDRQTCRETAISLITY